MKFVARFLEDETGATAIEYGMMLSLVALVLIGAVTLFGTRLSGTFNTLSNALK